MQPFSKVPTGRLLLWAAVLGIIVVGVLLSETSAGRSSQLAAAAAAPSVVKNIKTDFGATCNGVDNDGPAFVAFNTWAKQWQQTNSGLIELDIPSGSICYWNGGYGDQSWWAKGIKKMLVKGYGATFKAGAGGYFLGGLAEYQDNEHHVRVDTVQAGARSVTLKDPSLVSLFTVGNWAFIAGYDLQGLWHSGGYGFPSNPHFFEYVQISGVDQSSGVVSFSAPFKNTYKDTWPHYDDGGRWGPDQGGPATLYALDPSWDTEVEYDGLTIDQSGQTYANGKSITYRDVTFLGNNCGIPTQNKLWQMINGTMTNCDIEADKLVETVVISGTVLKGLHFQSSSIDELKMDNSRVTSTLIGTPKKATISDSYLKLFWPGAFAYGRSDEVVCTNCVIDEFKPLGVTEKGPSPWDGIQNDYTMSNGVIAVPNTQGAVRWAVPGTHAFFSGQYSYEVPFTITDVTQDSTYTYVHTTLTGGFPPTGLWYQGVQLNIQDVFAPQFTCTNCTDSSGDPLFPTHPAGAPLYSYSNAGYTGANSGTPNWLTAWGKLVSLKINVTKPYTGRQATLPLQVAGPYGTFVVNPDLTFSRPNPIVNLRVAGERIITPSGIVGAETGDDFSGVWYLPALPFYGWDVSFPENLSPFFPDIRSEDPSTWPVFTIEIITDQGFGDTVTPPLPPLPPPPPPPPPPPTCTENWTCSGWSVCSGGTQSRTCKDANSCGTASTKPALSQSCTLPIITPVVAPTFSVGDRVKVTRTVSLRNSLSSAKTAGSQREGSLGTLTSGPTQRGVDIWWKVNFDRGKDGYVQSQDLAKVTVSEAPAPSFVAAAASVITAPLRTLIDVLSDLFVAGGVK